MIENGRFTDKHSGSLVVFIIGMRINHVHKIGKWLPVARAMGPMIAELSASPDSGFIGSEFLLRNLRTAVLLQYWRDFERLEAYARDREQSHWPAWKAFNKAVGSGGAVGIFHETYCVPAAGHETIYGNMEPFGLGRFTGRQEASGSRHAARQRMTCDHTG